jgi:hypothetical protein
MAAPVIFEPVVYKRAYQKQSHLRSTWWTEKVPKMIECQKLPDPQTKPKPTPHSVKPDLETEKLVEALNKYFKEVDDYNLAEEVEEPSPVKARDSKSSDGSLELELPPSSSVQGAFSLIDRSSKLLPLFFFFFSHTSLIRDYCNLLSENTSNKKRLAETPNASTAKRHKAPSSRLLAVPAPFTARITTPSVVQPSPALAAVPEASISEVPAPAVAGAGTKKKAARGTKKDGKKTAKRTRKPLVAVDANSKVACAVASSTVTASSSSSPNRALLPSEIPATPVMQQFIASFVPATVQQKSAPTISEILFGTREPEFSSPPRPPVPQSPYTIELTPSVNRDLRMSEVLSRFFPD